MYMSRVNTRMSISGDCAHFQGQEKRKAAVAILGKTMIRIALAVAVIAVYNYICWGSSLALVVVGNCADALGKG